MKVSEAVEHLRKIHAGLAGGFRKEAEHHRNMSKHHMTAMGKAVAGDPQHEFHRCAKTDHDEMATDRDARAKHHDQMYDECEKVFAADDLTKNAPDDLVKRITALENAVVPSRISAITPNAPGVTAVPRAGGRPMPTEKPNVPIQFEKLTAIEE